MILQFGLPIPSPSSSTLTFSSHIVSDPTHKFLTSRFTHLSIATPPPSTTIRMGGGPRTYPGGVSKWQWKRMQAKKAKQLLRARLARERQIYEMRKRAELTAAVSELERPWEVVEKAPKLFSVTADEQLKVLADRFQKPGGFDLWSEKDGPQLFETVDGIPSARFFPKGVVHSIKPYGRITDGSHGESNQEDEKLSKIEKNDLGVGYQLPSQDSGSFQGNGNETMSMKKDGRRRGIGLDSGLDQRESCRDWRNDSKRGNGRKEESGLDSGLDPREGGRDWRNDGKRGNGRKEECGLDSGLDPRESWRDWRNDGKRGNGRKQESGLDTKVFDMNLQDDGSYGISNKEAEIAKTRRRAERK